ncbi:MAK16-like protein [Cavenderia fasciculata]|uniref:Protein MAK16 homolog n=1 Tax=Cavenderia fasciculata TaxID=261658 RepID=F4Q4B8_CACFS|nr:MAK16-like protein [Cavenderia fasciculata]EGG16980.1 MAK16-like protein [Cavenderia fasciculata]|eukprot:XP_004355462.1 MAK16-like protein [Cavenderia fasciculata]
MTMMQDDIIWSVLKNQFCSFKTTFNKARYCRNQFNATGLCNKGSCPLANSRYCTVREEEGVCYLYMKTIERAHQPAKLWERIKLDTNFMEAIDQIDKHLEYWPEKLIHRAKQRFIRITQYLIRMRKLRKEVRRELVPIQKKADRRDARREQKAMVAAQLTVNIKKELLERLKKKTYGDLYYFPEKVFNEVLEEDGEQDEMNSEEEEEEFEEEMEEGGATEYVDGGSDEEFYDDDEDDEDYDDIEGGDYANDYQQDSDEDNELYEESDAESDEDDDQPKTKSSFKRSLPKARSKKDGPQTKRKARIDIEYETEQETTSTTNTNNW